MNALDKAKQIIDKRRLDAESEAYKALTHAMQDQTFKTLYGKLSQAKIDFGQGKADKQEVLDLEEQVQARLKALDIDSVTPQYSCQKCHDTGFADGDRCECLKKELSLILRQMSGFSQETRFDEADFSMFQDPEQTKKIYDKMSAWCEGDFSNKNLVLLSGQTGVGKTFLASCMATRLIERGFVVTLVSAYRLQQDFKATNGTSRYQDSEEFALKYLESDVLFIDDLGSENITASCQQNIFTILNERKMRSLATVITTNLDMSELKENYHERVVSRIADKKSILIQMVDKDLRIK